LIEVHSFADDLLSSHSSCYPDIFGVRLHPFGDLRR
jgi:hypothetical protein